jgi:hypothetical protein
VNGRKLPIQIRAQVLRNRDPLAFGGTPIGCAAVTDDPSAAPGDKRDGKARWRQADVRRAIHAAEQAGLASYRVEIAPNGTIAIIVGAPSDTAPPSDFPEF